MEDNRNISTIVHEQEEELLQQFMKENKQTIYDNGFSRRTLKKLHYRPSLLFITLYTLSVITALLLIYQSGIYHTICKNILSICKTTLEHLTGTFSLTSIAAVTLLFVIWAYKELLSHTD